MKVEAVKIESLHASKPAPVEKEKPTKKEKPAQHAKESVTKEKAEEVARQLQNLSNNSMRFVVKDYEHVTPRNIVIEIVNEDNEVVARIPEETVSKMSTKGPSLTGLILDQVSD